MTKTLKTKPIRTGRLVRIVRPLFVVRVGYPLDFNQECERIRKEREKSILDFLHSQGIRWGMYEVPRALDKIVKALTYEEMRQNGFGGNERKIYTEERPELKGKAFHVQGVRFVKTGVRSAGYFDSHSGEYEPPFLSDEKTHRLLQAPHSMSGDYFDRPPEIDAENVELVVS